MESSGCRHPVKIVDLALQQAGGLYLSLLGRTPAVATLGALIGLLLFVYLVVRWLLLATVWTSVSPWDTDTAATTRAAQAGSTLASVGVVLPWPQQPVARPPGQMRPARTAAATACALLRTSRRVISS